MCSYYRVVHYWCLEVAFMWRVVRVSFAIGSCVCKCIYMEVWLWRDRQVSDPWRAVSCLLALISREYA